MMVIPQYTQGLSCLRKLVGDEQFLVRIFFQRPHMGVGTNSVSSVSPFHRLS